MASYSFLRYGFKLNRLVFGQCYKSSIVSSNGGRFNRKFHTTLHLDKIISFNLSDIGEGIRDVTVKEWFVKEGDTVEQFDNLCEVQSDKASVTITSRYDGKIAKIHKHVDDVALVGKPLLDFEITDEADSSSGSSSEEEDASVKSDATKGEEDASTATLKSKVLATPAVRRIAMENKVDLSAVPATGRAGRVLKGDVLEYLNLVPAGTNVPHPTLLRVAQPLSEKTGAVAVDRVEALKGIRKAMFKSMTESLKIPHFGYNDEIDMSRLVQVRDELKPFARARGFKLTYMPFMIKAASAALSQYPILNSSLDVANESIHYKSAHNISVAIDSPDGLVVPNVKNCQCKSVLQISGELAELQAKAQKGQLRPDDFANGTFSLSNIGVIGGTYTHPCIMPPQVSIGAVGKIQILPRFDSDGNLRKAHIMNVSWTADHRVIDGVTMAKFSEVWRNYLENPNLFLLDNP